MDNVKAWPARRPMKAFLVALAAVTAAPAAHAEREKAFGEQAVPSLEVESWQIEFAGTEESTLSTRNVHYVFGVSNPDKDVDHVVTVEFPISPPDSVNTTLYIVRDTILVIEQELHSRPDMADRVTFVDLVSGETVDSIVGMDPVLCPNERYWAYGMHRYPYGLPVGWTAIYLVYDMELSPDQNRKIEPDVGWDQYNRRLGFPIYPEHYAENQTYRWEEQLASGEPWYAQRSPIVWTEDGEQVVFVVGEAVREHSPTVLVRVDLREGIRSPRIHERDLDYERFLRPDRDPAPRSNAIDVEELELVHTDEGEPAALVRPVNTGRFREEVVVPLP